MAEYRITRELAGELTRFVYDQTGYHTIVCDQDAVIIGDSAGTRLGITHSGAVRILRGRLMPYLSAPAMLPKTPI